MPRYMKSNPLILTFLLFCSGFTFAQESYFQQEVNYVIHVRLNDTSHVLDGTLEIEYINNAPEALPFLYMHLWPNAYKNKSTAFAKQQVHFGQTNFYFCEKEETGYIEDLDFKVDNQAVRWSYDQEHIDIAKIELNSPIQPGDTISISSPFRVKIPAAFSRLGHVGQSYQITQWYPKPAVYDKDGWHPMPYLDMGEFYSEFGNFEVSITLPENYLVAATGTLQTESEQAFLAREVEKTADLLQHPDQEDLPTASSTLLKTISYEAKQVHDFAWFADKDFKVQKGAVALSNGEKVDTWTFFPAKSAEEWKNSIRFLNRSVKFYSDQVGNYPYPQATAVQAPLKAGGGMEYPMITIIEEVIDERALDGIIAHEVGHNWFYGILGFDERDHPWMDEGINTFYEHRYYQTFYGNLDFEFLPDFLTKGSEMSFLELVYLFQARRHLDQAIETPSDQLSRVNYLVSTYEKPAMVLRHLEGYLGQEQLDSLLRAFYEQWKFKHPQPADFRAFFEQRTEKDLSWFFDGYINSDKKLDYALKAVENDGRITVQNKGSITAPFSIAGLKDSVVVQEQWYEGFAGEKDLSFQADNYDAIILDHDRLSLDVNRKNNFSKNARTPFKLKLAPSIENDRGNTLYWLPVFNWNNYDKVGIGAVFYNTVIPAKPLQFAIAPLFATNSRDLTGLADVNYSVYPNSGGFQKIVVGASVRSANFDYNPRDQYFLAYAKTSVSIQAHFKQSATSNLQQYLQWRTFNLAMEEDRRQQGDFIGTEWNSNLIHELSFVAERRNVLNPSFLKVALEQQTYTDAFNTDQNYLKASLEWAPSFAYRKNKYIRFRFFGGAFLSNSRRNGGSIFPGAFNMTTQGFSDYRFDGWYFGRNEGNGIFSQQVELKDGGFKNAIGQGFNIGRTNNFLLALNTKFDFPVKIPLKAYFDLGYFDNAMPTGQNDTFKDQFLWSGGVMFEIGEGIFGIYFPLVNSDNIQNRFVERGNYFRRIAFSIDFAKLNPYYQMERLRF